PPGREVALAVMDEVDPVRLAQRAPRAPAEEPGIVPEGLAEAEHELADVAHLQLLHRTAQGGRYRVDADRAGLRGPGLQPAGGKRWTVRSRDRRGRRSSPRRRGGPSPAWGRGRAAARGSARRTRRDPSWGFVRAACRSASRLRPSAGAGRPRPRRARREAPRRRAPPRARGLGWPSPPPGCTPGPAPPAAATRGRAG